MTADLFMRDESGQPVPGSLMSRSDGPATRWSPTAVRRPQCVPCQGRPVKLPPFLGANAAMNDAQDKGTISIGLVHEALLVATARNLDIAGVLQQAGSEEKLLGAPRARVPAVTYARLWAALADAMDDEFFGMDSHPMRRGSYRLMCHAVLSCTTLGHALQRMLSFLRAVLDDLRGELYCEGEHAWIRLHDHGTPRRMFTYATWLMLVHGLACWLVRKRIPLLEASFRCSEPADVFDYRTRFCETPIFNAPVTQVRLDSKLLGLKVVETEANVRAFLRDAPANVLVKYRNEASISSMVRRRLRTLEPVMHFPPRS